jgi:hypothetical protein
MRTLGSVIVTHCVKLSTPGVQDTGKPCLVSPHSTGDDEDGRPADPAPENDRGPRV